VIKEKTANTNGTQKAWGLVMEDGMKEILFIGFNFRILCGLWK